MEKEVKLTGYSDIDELLIKTHRLLKDGEKLMTEIEKSLKWQPKYYKRTFK